MKNSDFLLEEIKSSFKEKETYFFALTQRIIQEGISHYPIFIATEQPIPFGKPFLINEEEKWQFYVTILEDLIHKNIIRKDRVTAFKEQIHDPLKKAAILLISSELPPTFLFLPYHQPPINFN